ncbi:MAG: hypothetical protein N2C14_33435 [Planctomycetales bacterium]
MESPPTLPAAETLEREFLILRCKIIEVAAILDRMDRGEGSAADDPRMHQARASLQQLLSAETDRAERIQILFSDPYEKEWFERFEPVR